MTDRQNLGYAPGNIDLTEDSKLNIPRAKGAPTELQALVKDDRVFSLTDDYEGTPSWTSLLRLTEEKKEAKCAIGTVILSKGWSSASHLQLSIRWENGKCEQLSKGCSSEYIAYGDRLFVLDRECIQQGSKVYLAGYPEIKGTVKEKRFLATGKCTEDSEVIFEDIDVSLLNRHSHGSVYNAVKILYKRYWLGVTYNYRTRLHLEAKDPSNGINKFCFVLDGESSQKYNIGDEITLGFNLLRSGKFVGDHDIESSHWLMNAYKFLHVKAIITNIEIDELRVHWIGTTEDPHFCPPSHHIPDAPSKVIPHDELKNVQLLFSAKHCQVTPNSIWKYNHDPESANGEAVPTSREMWTSKWLKLVDHDRWAYPTPEDVSEKSRFWGRDLTLEIMYTRSVVDVIWQNGDESRLKVGDVIPVHLGGVWTDWSLLHNGSIVRDGMDNKNKKKYGVILQVNENEMANVNWIRSEITAEKRELITTEVSSVPLYDLKGKTEFDFIWKLDQSPIVSPLDETFKVGVVVGMKASTGQVRVKVPMEEEKTFWPHQLTHYKCDVMLCPIEGHWNFWDDHKASMEGDSQGAPNSKDVHRMRNWDEAEDLQQEEKSMSSSSMKELIYADRVPPENIFANNNVPLHLLNSNHFLRAVETELGKIKDNIQDGLWIEYYCIPGNVMSAVLVGPKDSLFADVLFIFDAIVLDDFPRSDPHINFRSMGVTILPGRICKTGAVLLPPESRLTNKDLTCSKILNIFLEVKDYLGMSMDEMFEMDKKDTFHGIRPNNSDELSKFAVISVLDYVIAMLQNPPKNWSVLITSHYARTLPMIIKRLGQSPVKSKKVLRPLNNEGGDVPSVETDMEMDSHPWSNAYTDSIHGRVEELKKIHARISS